MKKFLFLLNLIAICATAQDKSISGDYQGKIEIPGSELKIVVHLDVQESRFSGTIDIPEQNAMGLRLTDLKLIKNEISFGIESVPGNASFKGLWKIESDSLSGFFFQSGMKMPMRMKKLSAQDVQKTKESLAIKLLKIEAYTDSILKKAKISGLSFGIIMNNEIILNKGFGYKDWDKKTNCDAHTLFAIGSCSKAFTAAVLSTLADEGKFDWEKPIKNYVPYFAMKDKFATDEINGVDICTHRSGLPRHDLVWYGASAQRKDLVKRIAFMEPNKAFRTTWQYNNFMFLTAGVVAEEITNDSWENLVQNRIFNSLDMKDSKIHFDDFKNAENKSIGYARKDEKITSIPYRNIDAMGPAGSIFSSSSDMLNWVKMILNEGIFNDKRVITKEQIHFITSPQMIMPNEGGKIKQLAYGCGWMIGVYNNKKLVTHGGNIDGFSANVMFLPEDKIGIVVLTNLNGTNAGELLSLYALDKLMGNDEYDWYEEKIGRVQKALEASENIKEKESAKNKPKNDTKTLNASKSASHPLQDYAGEYIDDAYGKIKIEFKDGKLTAWFNAFEMKMTHSAYETFNATFEDEDLKMTFFTNDFGKIEWLQMQLEALVKPIRFVKSIPDYAGDEVYMKKICAEYLADKMVVTISKENNKVMMKASDGQEYEIVPSADNTFKIKGIDGYNIEFIFDTKGISYKIILHQPNGDFEAIRK